MRKYGVLIDMMMSVPSTTSVHQIKDRTFIGMVVSTVSMSLVNLK